MTQAKKATVVESRVTKLGELVDIIERDEQISAADIAHEMGLSIGRVYNMISYQNLRATQDPTKYPHIYNTGIGYSTVQRKEYSVREAGRRMKVSYGILSRGLAAFAHCKLIAPKYFKSLSGEFNPSAQRMVKMLQHKIK